MSFDRTKLIKIMAKELDVPEEKLLPEAELIKDLGADSLDLVELVQTLEEEFEVGITDEQQDGIKTVADIERLLGELTSAAT